MKNFLTQVFVVLGVMFLVVIIFAAYFFITDPYNLKPLIFGSSPAVQPTEVTTESTTDASTVTSQTTESAGGFQLSEAQKQALASLGIDPATVPSSISAEQEICFIEVLGEARVLEIKAGAVPDVLEFLKAKSCIQ